jgi:hypothetical protein
MGNIKNGLKAKKRLLGLMETEFQKASRYNSINIRNTRPYSVKEAIQAWMKLAEELIDLKVKLHTANVNGGMLKKIFLLSELKNQAIRLQNLDCSSGLVTGRYDNNETEKHVELTVVERDSMVFDLQIRIESIEEELERFNHNTVIE